MNVVLLDLDLRATSGLALMSAHPHREVAPSHAKLVCGSVPARSQHADLGLAHTDVFIELPLHHLLTALYTAFLDSTFNPGFLLCTCCHPRNRLYSRLAASLLRGLEIC